MSFGHDFSLFEPHFNKAVAAGLTLSQIVTILVNFGTFAEKYGPEIFTIVSQIAIAVKTGNVAGIAALAVTYGPQIQEIANAIAAMFGVTLPAS
jgi:hypothetical protein